MDNEAVPISRKIDTILGTHAREILLIGQSRQSLYARTPHAGLDKLAAAVDRYNQELETPDGAWGVRLVEELEGVFVVMSRKGDSFQVVGVFNSLDELINRFNPAVVGFTFTSKEAGEVVLRAKEVMDRDDAPLVIAGGAHATVVPESLMKKTGYFDMAFVGESEGSLVQLIRNAELQMGIADIGGVCYRSEEGVEVIPNTLIREDLQITPADSRPTVWEGRPVIRYQHNRGCHQQCNFCNQGSAAFERGDEEMTMGFIRESRNLGHEYLFFEDGDWSPRINRRLLEEMIRYAEETREDGSPSIAFGGQMRWDDLVRDGAVDQEAIDKLKASNFKYLFISVETISTEVLANMGKGQTGREASEVISEVFKALKGAGIEYGIPTIIGYTGDTIENHTQTLEFIAGLSPRYIYIETAKVMPGTRLAEESVGNPGVIADLYTWNRVEEIDGLLESLKTRLYFCREGSPDDVGGLNLISDAESARYLRRAHDFLTGMHIDEEGREYKFIPTGSHNAAYARVYTGIGALRT